MQTKDHFKIARYLTQNTDFFKTELSCRAFELGSVFPDVNPFSYLRGAFDVSLFKGHNYENSSEFVRNEIRRINELSEKSVWDCFRLGVAMHYIQDGFTHTHNDGFLGTLNEHFEYESRLHKAFDDFILKFDMEDASVQNVFTGIKSTHKAYSQMAADVLNDCKYILGVSVGVVQSVFERETITA